MHGLNSHTVANITDISNYCSKAEEICRILDSRGQSSLKGLNVSGDAKLIICLDCAASSMGISLNKVASENHALLPMKN